MNTRLDTDPELLDLVRRADPMRDPRMRANAGRDTESALRLLALELERPPAPRRARRRSALRIVVLAGVVAAAVFVVANVTSTGNGSAVSPAQAQILRHVRDALVWPAHAIYEEQDIGTVTARDGARFTSEDHEWIGTSPPYNMRLIRSWNGKVQWEQAFVNGRLDLYDPRTNTVYLAPGVAANQVTDEPQWNSALSNVASLLSGKPQCGGCKYPNVTINSHAVLDGKPAIEINSDGGRFSYWISPRTYQPLQSVDRWDRLPDGQRGVGVDLYPIVRVLTGSAASPKLLSLHAQHPDATLDHSPTDYAAALRRMNNVQDGLTRCSRSGCS
ncbi:MAG TPA: hypothetical protein VHV75_18325 [Solirubrobacteraceae bacterium]|jgi:hypothetical protein|nr:hypothetical protein [Solirubrobacteraceae bacterium]